MSVGPSLPAKLYKYREITPYTQRLLIDGEVYFSGPKSFNDPFDCRVRYSAESTEARLKAAVDSNELRLRDRIEELYPGIPLAEAFAKAHANRDMLIPDRAKLALDCFVADTGVFCLASRNDSILMWSHYAQQHTGICVEFATSMDAIFQHARPVRYSSDVPVYEFLNEDLSLLTERALFRKAEEWGYEGEWRIIGVKKAKTARVLQPGTITGVILGPAISSTMAQDVAAWCKQMSVPPTLYRAVLHPDRFQVDIQPA